MSRKDDNAVGPMSSASSTSGGFVTGHPERGLAVARTKQYVENMDRLVEWSKKHPEFEILPPDPGVRASMWFAQYRNEEDVPEGQNRVIYRSSDPGMLMDYLETILRPQEKM